MENRRWQNHQRQQSPSISTTPLKTQRLQDVEEDQWWKSDEEEEEEEEEGSMAAKAIRASSGSRRNSSLSSAYATPHPLHPKPQPPAIRLQSQSQDRTHTSNNSRSNWIHDSIPSSTPDKRNSADSSSKPSFWSTIARKAKSIIDDEGDDVPSRSQHLTPSTFPPQSQKPKSASGSQFSPKPFGSHESTGQYPQRSSDGPRLHKGFGAIASSLTYIGGTIGNALEEGLTIVENRTADIIQETRKLNVRKKFGAPALNEQDEKDRNANIESQMQTSVQPQMQSDLEIQFKASRDIKRKSEDVENETQENHSKKQGIKRKSEDVENETQENHSKKQGIMRSSEDVENETQKNHTEKQGIKRKSEDVENETQENHSKKQGIKRKSEDRENETQENHSKKQGIKRKSEDVENETQENHSKKQGIKRRSDDVENKTQENHTKKQRLSITSEARVEVALPAFDIMDKYKDATLLPKWKAFHTVIFLEKDDGLVDCSRIAAFDFDGCIVNTSVKRIGADAWSLMYPTVPEKLQKLHKDGFKLVIFTNESNIDRWINKRQRAVDSKIGRLNNFIKTVNVPIQVFIACGFDRSGSTDPFRKPKPGMWHVMETKFNSGIKIDMDQSFYVGDAAGRRSDHSDADKKFAEAVGLKFYVPEEYFDA